MSILSLDAHRQTCHILSASVSHQSSMHAAVHPLPPKFERTPRAKIAFYSFITLIMKVYGMISPNDVFKFGNDGSGTRGGIK
jgi:hypothetical protein